jgi:tripartite-type tricarboxylate transporter receptor subunit TctC
MSLCNVKSLVIRLFCAFVISLCAGSVVAQDFPSKPIRLIVGPGPDTTARAVGAKISASIGHQVVVEQLPGAGGVIAAQTVAKAAPDGYTLLLSTGSYSILQAINPQLKLSLLKDYQPVAQLASLSFVLLANPGLPANTLPELIKYAKDNPGKINCASTGVGTTAHLGCEMLKVYAGVNIVHVPYNGNPAAVVALLAGQVQIFFSTGPALVNVSAGKLKALAVTGPTRMKAIPSVQTVVEAGFPDLGFISWNGIHAPAGTPKAVVDKLGVEFAKAIAFPDVQNTLITQGFDPESRNAEQFSVFVKADVERWAKSVKDTGAKAE